MAERILYKNEFRWQRRNLLLSYINYRAGFFYYIGKFFELAYVIKSPSGQDAHNVPRKAASQLHTLAHKSVQFPHE